MATQTDLLTQRSSAIQQSSVTFGQNPGCAHGTFSETYNGKDSARTLTAEHELFVDLRGVESMRGVERRSHQLEKFDDKPILFAARPWEGENVSAIWFACVVRDAVSGLWKMWYRGGDSSRNFEYRTNVCLAISSDGIQWQRPDLGIFEHYDNPHTNIVMRAHEPHGPAFGRFDSTVVVEDHDDRDRRFKSLTFQYNTSGGHNKYRRDIHKPSGYYVGWSTDGLNWEEHPEPMFMMGDGYGDTGSVMIDRRHNRYVAFVKMLKNPERQRTQYRDGAWMGMGCLRSEEGAELSAEQVHRFTRARAISHSRDFIHWSEPVEMLPVDSGDPADLEWYNNSCWQYGSQYLGLIEAYHAGSTDTVDMQLISSRDGLEWERSFDRSPILPAGRPDRDWDGGGVYGSSSPPVQVGDKLYFYYTGAWNPHGTHASGVPLRNGSGGGLGLATLRLDGFVSLYAGSAGGVVRSEPFVPVGDRICINADCRGELRAALIGADGLPVPGFAVGECKPVRRDATRIGLEWKGGAPPVSGPLRLEFHFKDCDVYAYWCEEI
jgi:hypothetical protein